MTTRSEKFTVFRVPKGMSKEKLKSLLSEVSACKNVEIVDIQDGRFQVTFERKVDGTLLYEKCLPEHVFIMPEIGEKVTVQIDGLWFKIFTNDRTKFDEVVKTGVRVSQNASQVTLEGTLTNIQKAVHCIETLSVHTFDDSVQRDNKDEVMYFDQHIWIFAKDKLATDASRWESRLSIRNVDENMEVKGKQQDISSFKDFLSRNDLLSVKVWSLSVHNDVDSVKRLTQPFNVDACQANDGNIKLIGRPPDLASACALLERSSSSRNFIASSSFSDKDARNTVATAAATAGAAATADDEDDTQTGGAAGGYSVSDYGSRSGNLSHGLSLSYSRGEGIELETPVAKLKVEIFRGDLTKQKTEVIVNPANQYLDHCGGAAKAIADAAGYDLVRQCDDFIRRHRKLLTSEVMHTTSGRLKSPIRSVIHAVGPKFGDCKSVEQCMQLLEKTFFNCFVHANDVLRAKSVSLPAISSGTFGVPWDIVCSAAYRSVMSFDKHFHSLPSYEKYLNRISFVNIDHEITQHLIDAFSERMSVVSATSSSDHVTLSSRKPTGNRNASNRSLPVRAGVNDSMSMTADTKCCVCNKSLTSANKSLNGCGHKCCSKCVTKQCLKCLPNKQSSAAVDRNKAIDVAATDVQRTTPENAVNGPRRRNSISGSPPSKEVDDTLKDDTPSNGPAASAPSRLRRSNSLTVLTDCSICMEVAKNPKKLSCGHEFCTKCIDQAFVYSPKCPCCGQIFGSITGNQPIGTMKVERSSTDLSGFRGAGTLIIHYHIPSGVQDDNHPHPGKRFKGTTRTAYLPGNAEGKQVLELLKKAFDARLVFTVGRSTTTGQDDVVTWNDIHHKTSVTGQYGYPDYTYLSRVKQELAAKGIKPTDAVTTPAVGTLASNDDQVQSMSTSSEVRSSTRLLADTNGTHGYNTSETLTSSSQRPVSSAGGDWNYLSMTHGYNTSGTLTSSSQRPVSSAGGDRNHTASSFSSGSTVASSSLRRSSSVRTHDRRYSPGNRSSSPSSFKSADWK